MAHYLDPRNGLTFKRVFGEHKHLCMSLLNSMLPLEKPVVGIEYQTGELLPEIEMLRNSIVDVRCTDSDGRQFIVEMQMYWTESFKSRVLLNASKAYVMQLNKAERYELLQPVYALSFVNEIFEKSPEMQNIYYHHYRIVNIKNTQKQIKGLEFVFIELPKFRPQSHGEKKLHELWLRFLTEINERTREVPLELLENGDIREAVQYMEISAYTKEQLFTYDKFRDGIMTERSVISDAWHKGEETGLQKGRKEGLQEGRKEGLQEGRKEIALNLLQMGISPEDIMQSTRLTEDEIRMLR
ncbi:MAG: Rpn family recombination-promoting nuclease/putative transposase [Dysgonamonadaceae bacterium]|jgi:predicted transposase/invertase (TIGR01784 family)|nr:Rpn family recombination-promoting nuclease/putative transposase [Dysgonamonadaceae bacterium]